MQYARELSYRGELHMATRAYNFFAGPAVLPLSVVKETADAILDFENLGVSVMEVSHRSKEFDRVMGEAQSDLLDLMGLSADEYSAMFLQGGASTQFAMIPMNFLSENQTADYINTGTWAKKAIKEAKLFGKVNIAGTSEDANFTYLPKDLSLTEDAAYVHITSNNTIFGTQWKTFPDTGDVPLVCDMSSDILSRRLDFSKFDLIYAGAQKNLGPSGVTIVVLRKKWLEVAKDNIPTMLKYQTHVDKGSMFNTPPCIATFVSGRVLKWIKAEGGLEPIEERNNRKAKMIYDLIDAYPEFYRGTVRDKNDRSLMNITFNLPSEGLEAKFVAEAKARNMLGLKGHRSVGGIRASVYNACPMEAVEALTKFMEDFYRANKAGS